MPASRLELLSDHGDQTLSSVRVVLHGSKMQASEGVFKDGLSSKEGRAIVSTNLIQTYREANDSGLVTAIGLPEDFHIGNAVFTTAYIDRVTKLVYGAPLRYADARQQLALYLTAATEDARARIEAEVRRGVTLESRPNLKIDQRYVIGSFYSSSGLKSIISHIAVSVEAFEMIDFFGSLERSLKSLFEVREVAQSVLVPTMVRDVILGTVESVVLSRLRLMRWQGLAMLGYRFRQDREEVKVPQASGLADYRRQIDNCDDLIASSDLFSGELAWLRVYAANELGVMRVESDGYERSAA